MEKVILLKNKTYDLVKIQRAGVSAIYKNGSDYLRIGEKEKIKRDLASHRKMESSGFPVAKITEEGELNGAGYFIETSLGDKMFSRIFSEDMLGFGSVSDAHFDSFLDIVKKFMRAQLETEVHTKDLEGFVSGIHLDILCNELPWYREKIQDVFADMTKRLSVFPFVITHGDFNPHNIYPAGVIDFEDSFHGPFGYDIVGAIIHMDYVPDSQTYEYFARYRLTAGQKQKYFSLIDTIAQEACLPKLSEFKKDFEFCKAAWLLVRMDRWPKLQQFRYDLFKERFLR